MNTTLIKAREATLSSHLHQYYLDAAKPSLPSLPSSLDFKDIKNLKSPADLKIQANVEMNKHWYWCRNFIVIRYLLCFTWCWWVFLTIKNFFLQLWSAWMTTTRVIPHEIVELWIMKKFRGGPNLLAWLNHEVWWGSSSSSFNHHYDTSVWLENYYRETSRFHAEWPLVDFMWNDPLAL